MNQLQHQGSSEPNEYALLLGPRFPTGSGVTTIQPFPSSSSLSSLSTTLALGGDSNPYSHWYINSAQQQFVPRKPAYMPPED